MRLLCFSISPLLLCFWCLPGLSINLWAQSSALTVLEGYGDGVFAAGDTVSVFSRELAYAEAFQGWSFSPANLEFVQDEREWMTRFIMPTEAVIFTAQIATLPPDFLEYVELPINGITKPVYYAIPEDPLATVMLLHGTGGSVNGWVGTNRDQNFSLLKELYAAGFAVLVIESRESSLNEDLNGDGKIRWLSYPIDLENNIEYQDVNETINYFVEEFGLDAHQLHAIGMSAGGSFAGTVSQAFAAQSTVIYGATSQPNLVATTEIPIQFCLMENDAILDPGDDELAASYSQQLNDRGICSSYYLHSGYAFYPAYFQRVGLTAEASMAIFQDLQTNEWINDASYFVGTVAELQVAFQLAPAQWPSLLSLSTMERAAVGNLLAVAGAEHQFFAAHNQRTISFLLDACAGGPSSTPTNLEISLNGRLYPNPSGGEIWLDTGAEVVGYQIFDSRGRLRKAGEYRRGERLTLDWSSGLYFFVIEQPEGTTYLRFILD